MKILFIALAHSSHTISWVSMFENTNDNLLVYGINRSQGNYKNNILTFNLQENYSLTNRILVKFKKIFFNILPLTYFDNQLIDLRKVIKQERPDIVHTLGFEDAGFILTHLLEIKGFDKEFKWVHTFRGGPELKFTQNHSIITKLLQSCDSVICDNPINYNLLKMYNVNSDNLYMKVVPGTGGVHLNKSKDELLNQVKSNRTILIPKAYECNASKVLPIFEAIRNIWHIIQPCKIIITAASDEAKMWFNTMPEEIKISTIVYDRISREEFLELLETARILVAPSLLDGIPNVLYESMALGVAPILSPIETLIGDFRHLENVFYARNLYVNEIEDAIVKLMDDDEIVAKIVSNNYDYVKQFANKETVLDEIHSHYQDLLYNNN